MRPEIPVDLLQYTKRFLSMPQTDWKSPKFPIYNYGVVTTLVLHREGQFQSELIIASPQTDPWPGEHSHPLVDSIEVALHNCKGLTRHGEPVLVPDVVYDGRYLVYLAHDDPHGSPDNEEGVSLISCQKWAKDVDPSSVGLSWHGQPVSGEHKNILQEDSVAA